MLRQVQDFQADQKVSANDFVLFLKEWVLANIAVCDKKMGIYLIKLKQEGMTMQVKREAPPVNSAEGQRLVIK